MADAAAVAMAEGFTNVQRELRIQGLVQKCSVFSGESTKKYLAWQKDLEKTRLAAQIAPDTMKAIALQTTQGAASDFLTRELAAHPGWTWDETKTALADRFSDAADILYARRSLSKLKQKKGESVSTFVESIRMMAEQAYVGHDLAGELVQRQLVDVFTEGVLSDSVVRKLLRERPVNLAAALTVARAEQATNRLYDMHRRVEEPMDVDVLTAAENARVEKLEKLMNGVEGKLTQVLKIVNSTEPRGHGRPYTNQNTGLPGRGHGGPSSMPEQSYAGNSRPGGLQTQNRGQTNRTPLRWTEDGTPICYKCKVIGHIGVHCPKNGGSGPASH